MAGISFDIETGKIDKGDDKTLTIEGKDSSGNAVTLSAITAKIQPENGTDTTYNIGNFSVSNKVYSLEHTFDTVGSVMIDVTVKDKGGHVERETKEEYVRR